jgi:hypothetical protein
MHNDKVLLKDWNCRSNRHVVGFDMWIPCPLVDHPFINGAKPPAKEV